MGENHIMISYIYQEFIHRKHQLPNSLATTRRRLQPPILRLQPEGTYNSLNSLAPTRRKLQPPRFSVSNRKVATTTYPFPVQTPCNINVNQLFLSQTLPLSLSMPLALSNQPVTCYCIQHVTSTYHYHNNLSNQSLSHP